MAELTYVGDLPTTAMAVYPDGTQHWIGWTYDLLSSTMGKPVPRKDYDLYARDFANRLGSDPHSTDQIVDDEFHKMESYLMAQLEPSATPAGNTISTTFLEKLDQGAKRVMDGIDSAYNKVITWGSNVHDKVDPVVRSASEGVGQLGQTLEEAGGVVSAFSPKTGERLERIGGALATVDDIYARESDTIKEDLAEAKAHPTVFGKPIDNNPQLREKAASLREMTTQPKKRKEKKRDEDDQTRKGIWNLRR